MTPTDEHRAIAATLKGGARRAIWLGALAARSSRYSELRALARAPGGGQRRQLWRAGRGRQRGRRPSGRRGPHRSAGWRGARRCRAHRPGDARAGAAGSTCCSIPSPGRTRRCRGRVDTLGRARCVVAVGAYASEEMKRVAHVLLPAGTFAETSGTYVNLEGRWQSQGGAARPLGASRPAWKILRVLGNLLDLPGFDYQSSEQVRDELQGAAARRRRRRRLAAAGTMQASRHASRCSICRCIRSTRCCAARRRCCAPARGARACSLYGGAA